jgi:hypothetical protein
MLQRQQPSTQATMRIYAYNQEEEDDAGAYLIIKVLPSQSLNLPFCWTDDATKELTFCSRAFKRLNEITKKGLLSDKNIGQSKKGNIGTTANRKRYKILFSI